MKYVTDNSGTLAHIFMGVMEHRSQHTVLISADFKFLYVWRYGEKLEDGRPVIAEVCKMSNKDRDIYGYDVRIEVDADIWQSLSRKEQIKVADHELMHIGVEREGLLPPGIEEYGEDDHRDLKVDKEGRVCYFLKPHDVDVRRFENELMRYGLTEEENKVRLFLNDVYEKKGVIEKPKNTMTITQGETSVTISSDDE